MKAISAVIKAGALCLLIVFFTPHLVFSQTVSENHYMIRFSQSDLQFSRLNEYDLIIMKQAASLSDLGKPVLPMRSVSIAIPHGTRAVRVEARSLNPIELGGSFFVLPGQPPRLIGDQYVELTTKPDQQLYNSTTLYPENIASLDHQSNLAGQQIVHITVYPLQYLPAERKLIFHHTVELIVYCEQEPLSQNDFAESYYKFTENQRRSYEDMIKGMVINPEDVYLNPSRKGPSHILQSDDFDHVVITSNAFAAYFQPLVYWHEKKGLKDTVITTEWIYANYSGPGDSTKIRQFVQDAHTNWGTMYFLIGGEDDIVPLPCRLYYQVLTPSDQYYSDYDDDWTHEVFVGRAPIDNINQVNIFVNKVLQYEKNPLSDFALESMLIGMDLDASTHAEALKQLIDGYIPAAFDVHKVYDSHNGNHKDSCVYYFNAGMNLVNHADHCNETVMGTGDFNHGWYINCADVDGFTNDDRLCIVVTVGCDPNAMDCEDCIAEHFVIYNAGQAGVAFVGNTRYGYYYIGNPYGLSSELDYRWWDGLFSQNQNDLGKAFVYAKHQFGNGSGITRHCEWTFNIQGEPAMPLWTAEPDTMIVNYNPFVPATPHNFTVTVTDNDGTTPLQNALVCCWIPDQVPELYVTGYTNASGQAVLNISPTTPGDTMLVTVTRQNYIQYEGYAVVTAISGPFILPATLLVDTLGNGRANPGESVDMGVWAKNIGIAQVNGLYGILTESDPYVNITADSSWYGSIPANGDSSLSNPFYTFLVSNSCPDGHVIDFPLEFHDQNDSMWTPSICVTVYAPLLTYQGYHVMNTYGILYPGQSEDLLITLKNEGGEAAPNVTSILKTASGYIAVNDSLAAFGTISPGDTAINSGDVFHVTASFATPYETPVDFSLIVQSGVYIDTLGFTLIVGRNVPTDTGYYYAYFMDGPPLHAPDFEWIAIDSTQTANPGISLDLDRNETVLLDLPFTFKYYGVDYDRISVSANGWIAMDSTLEAGFANNSIPNEIGPPAMIAALWDYLQPGNPGEPSDVYYYYDAAHNRFIVEYFRIEHYPAGGNYETFEVILHDPVHYPTPSGDGEITFQYLLTMQLASSLTIGIEDSTETVGVQYYYNGTYDSLAMPITDSFAIKYTTFAPGVGVEEETKLSIIPVQTMLAALFPNPFTRSTGIVYQIANTERPENVSLRIFDASGRLVKQFDHLAIEPVNQVIWNGRDNAGRAVAAGVYFIRFEADDYRHIEKAILLR